jgi:hypothetical protein
MSMSPAARRTIPLALMAALLIAWQGAAKAESAAMSREETVTLLMEWLGVADASRQVSRRLEQLVALETRLGETERQQVLARLAPEIGSEQAYQQTWSYLLNRYDEKLMNDAVGILRQPRVLRMRELEQHARARQEIHRLLEAHRNESGAKLGNERRDLLSRLDDSLHTTELMLLLQSSIEQRLQTLLAAEYYLPDTISGPWEQQIREQSESQHRALVRELVLNYSAHVYRSMNDEALRSLVEILEKEPLQQVLDIAVEGFAGALKNPVE